MKRKQNWVMALFFMVGVSLLFSGLVQQETAKELFEKALYFEETKGELEEAIDLYKRVVEEFPNERATAAKAQLQIGICLEKLGFQEAEKAFQKVVENYPDQKEVVNLAREKLSILQKARAVVEEKDQGFKMTEIPIDPEKTAYAFISPDGNKLAYVSMMGDIFVIDIASGKEIRLNKTPEFDYWCFWSPDCQKIAYLDDRNNFYVVSAQGGRPQTLVKPDADFVKEYGGGWPSGWSPDSQNINVWLEKKGLVAIPISGGEWKDIYSYSSPELTESDYSPGTMLYLSPDDKYITYTKNKENLDIYIMPTEGGEAAQITDHPAKDSAGYWSYDGRWLIFISDRNGKREYWIVGISPDGKREGEPFQIPFLSTVPTNSALCWTQDNQIGLSYGKQISNLFISNVDGSEEIQLTNMESGDAGPKWSPDNRYIAFISDRGGEENVWIVPVQGGEPKNVSGLLTSRPGVAFTRGIAWHPDGRRVSCWIYNGSDREQWTMDIESGEVQKIPFDYDGYMGGMDWSPDGKRIAFSYSNTMTQNSIKDSEVMISNIYTVSAEGGEPVRITKGKEKGIGFSRPRWSPDGKRIAFVDENDRIWTIGSEGGEPHLITDKSGPLVNWIRWIYWSPDGETIYFCGYEEEKKQPKFIFCSVSSQGGEPEIINRSNGIEMALSPDGKKIVYWKVKKMINQYWLLDNFLPKTK